MISKMRRKANYLLGRLLAPSFVVQGKGCRIDRTTKFGREYGQVKVGKNALIFRYGEIMAPSSIGENTFINRSAYIRAETSIGANCAIGPFVKFITDTHEVGPPESRAGKRLYRPIKVGDGVWIGASATILGGVTIGNGAIVGAGSLVTRDVPANCVYAGNPARLVRALKDDQPAQAQA